MSEVRLFEPNQIAPALLDAEPLELELSIGSRFSSLRSRWRVRYLLDRPVRLRYAAQPLPLNMTLRAWHGSFSVQERPPRVAFRCCLHLT